MTKRADNGDVRDGDRPVRGNGSEDMTSELIEREDEILTSREAQEFLKIGRTKLWELTKSNQLPAYRVGSGRTSSLRYKKSELLAWLERNRVQA